MRKPYRPASQYGSGENPFWCGDLMENHFPVEGELKGKNLLFIAGGIGLAPLRSVINYVLDNRVNYGRVGYSLRVPFRG